MQTSGAIWWRFDYRFEGKRKTLSFGTYPDTKLGAARAQRDRARELVEQGVDPSAARKAAAKDDPTQRLFSTVAKAWWESRRPGWSDEYATRIWNRLKDDVLPALGAKPIEEIVSADVLAALRAIEGRGIGETVYRVKGYISEIFGYAIGEALVESDPTDVVTRGRLLKAKPAKEKRAFVRPVQLGEFLKRFAVAGEDEDVRDALWLTILAAVRTDETRFAAAAEFEGLDGTAPLWRIPAARMKMRNEHLVPLSRQATAIAARRIERAVGRGLLFARPTRSGTLSENSMLYALYRMGYHSRATVHGFRSTFSTWANEQGWNRDWIERQLAHVEEAVRGTYNSAEYLDGRRRLLQAWADMLDGLRPASARDEFAGLLRF